MTGLDQQQTFAFTADAGDEGERLDRFLASRLPGMSRSRLKALIKQGRASQGGRTIVDPNARVKPGEAFEIVLPPPEPAVPKGEPIPLDVVFEDAHLIVIDKPPGLVVHPAAGNWTGTLVNALIAHCGASLSGIGGVRRPGIVHRLDKQTSGLMVAAKTDAAHQALARQFADHGRSGPLERHYAALVWGAPRPARGVIDAALGRSGQNRTKMAVVSEGGRDAVTRYRVTRTFGAKDAPVASQVDCRLETGRTHQIRVHMAHIGHPLLGDAAYGAGFRTKAAGLGDEARQALADLGRQALHACVLGFVHPATGETLRFESPLPGDMAKMAETLAKNRSAPS